MSNPATFNQTVNETVKQFIYWMQQIETLKDRLATEQHLSLKRARI